MTDIFGEEINIGDTVFWIERKNDQENLYRLKDMGRKGIVIHMSAQMLEILPEKAEMGRHSIRKKHNNVLLLKRKEF